MKGKKPKPEDYGLSGDVKALEQEIENKSVSEHRKRNLKYLLINILVNGTLMSIGASLSNGPDVSPLFLIGMIGGGVIGFFQLLTIWLADGKAYLQSNELYQNIQKYNTDLAKYEYDKALMKANYWDSLNGHQFEHAFADACRLRGYSATVSKSGGDGGIDIMLRRNGYDIAVQCKAHQKKIGPAPVRDLYGVMMARGIIEGWLVSKSGFSDNAKDFAKGKNIKLLDLNDVIQFAGEGFYNRYGIVE